MVCPVSSWQGISCIDDAPEYEKLRHMWSSDAKFLQINEDQFLVVDRAMGYTGMTPDWIDSYCFKEPSIAEAVMHVLAEAWQKENTDTMYDIWEELMWAFFPDSMGN